MVVSPELAHAIPTSVIARDGRTWKRHVVDNTSRGADGVKLGDLNGDGLLDLVTGWEEGSRVRAYLHPGPQRVRQPWPRVTVGTVGDPEEAIFADLDGDGRMEVVSCTEGRVRTVFRHRFTGSRGELLQPERWRTAAFPATRGAQAWMQAAVLDLDGQHGPDLLTASKGSNATVGWLQSPVNPNDLTAWTFRLLREAGWIMSLIPHDMDGDGDFDVVFSDRKGTRSGVFWLENPGAKANRNHVLWREHQIGALGREVMFADVADVNQDGLADVAVAVKPMEILLYLRAPGTPLFPLSGHTSMVPPRAQSVRSPSGKSAMQLSILWEKHVLRLDTTKLGDAKAVKVADVNGDAWPDVLFTCENARGQREGIGWLERQAQGPWMQHPLGGPEGLKYDLMQTLDLDADGDVDVLTCEEADNLGLIWYENPARSHAATND